MKRLAACILAGGANLLPLFAIENPPPPPPASSAHVLTDEEIRLRVVKAILVHPDIFAAALRVSVENGAVTLRGTVRHEAAKQAAEKSARGMPGVRSVKNELKAGRVR